MFPGAHSVVYRNEEGEVLGWDNPSYSDEPDVDDFYGNEFISDEEYEAAEMDEDDDSDEEDKW